MSKFSALALLVSIAWGSAVSSEPAPRIIVEAAMSDGVLHYLVQGDDTSNGRLLDSLGALLGEHGPEVPLLIVVHDKAPVGTLFALKGLVEKVGFLNVRIFVAGATKRMMVEVSFENPAVPYSGSL